MMGMLRGTALVGTMALAVGAAGLQVWPGSGTAADDVLVLTLQADQTNSYGMPWDGLGPTRFGFLGFHTTLPVSSPPDLVACIVIAGADSHQRYCDMATAGDSPASRCHDHYACTFRLPVPRDRAFGVVIYDLDDPAPGGLNDLVEAFIVADRRQDAAALAEPLREAVATLSPTEVAMPAWTGLKRPMKVFPEEERRRQGVPRIVTRRDCAGTPCRMTQSRVSFGGLP